MINRPTANPALLTTALLLISSVAGAATTTTPVEGSKGISEQGCLQQLTTAVGDGENCMYNGGPSQVAAATPYGEVTGPYQQVVYYDATATPGAFSVAWVRNTGDAKIQQAITGSVSVDDNGTPLLGSDDSLSFTLTLRSPGTGDVIRHLGTSVVDRYTTMTQVLAPTPVSSATANGAGGFDYVIGSQGFPELRTFALAGPCQDQPFGSLDCEFSFTSFFTTGQLDPNGWNITSPAGLSSLEGNTGARTTGSLTGAACVDTGANSDCRDSKVSFAPLVIGPNQTPGSGVTAEDVGWDQLTLKVSTNAAGNVTAVAGFDVQEYQTFGPNFICGSDPGAAINCNSWLSGYFTLAGIFGPVGEANDDGPVTAQEGVAEIIDVLANDLNFSDPLTVTISTPPAKGVAVVNGSPGNAAGITVTYTANAGATGTDTFVYTVDDGSGSDTATVTLLIGVGANDDTATTTRNTPVNISVGANDTGFGTPVTVTVDGGSFSSGGSAVVTVNNVAPGAIVVTYTPASAAGTPGYVETFEYSIDDGILPPDTATVSVTVSNAIPDARDGGIAISTTGLAPLGRTGSFTAPGAGGSLGNTGGSAAVTISGQGTRGTATVAGSVITYTVTDTAFYTGSDSFSYLVTDADGETDGGTVTVTIANATPALAAGAVTTSRNRDSTPVFPGITAGNGSPAQHTLTVTQQAVNGTCTVTPANGTGSLVYSPDTDFAGDDSCQLTLTDGDGQAAAATFTVSVRAIAEVQPNIGGASGFDPWSLVLLAGLPLLRRRRRAVIPSGTSLVLALTAGLLIAGTPGNSARAQSAEGRDAGGMQEIVVTSRKVEEKLQDVPLAITAFDSNLIEASGITNLNDVAELTPGLSFFNAFGENLPVPVIRGVVPTNIFDRNSAAIFVDGVYISGREGLNFSQLDVERIEVVKGPQSALYGRDAFSGAINYVTKKPSDTPEAKVGVELGNRDKYKASGSMSGPLVEDGSLRGRIAALYDDWDGSYDNSLAPQNDLGGYEFKSFQGSLLWLPMDTMDITLSYYKSDDKIDESPTVSLPTNCEDRLNDDNNTPRLQNFCGEIPDIEDIPGLNGGKAIPKVAEAVGEERQLDRVNLNINWDLPDYGMLSALTGYSKTRQKSVSDFNRSLGENTSFLYCDPAAAEAPGSPNSCGTSPATQRFFTGIYNPQYWQQTEEYSQEIRFSSNQDQRLRYLAGGYWYTVNATSQPGNTISTRPLPVSQSGDAIGLAPFDPSAPNFAVGTAIFYPTFLPDGGLDPLLRDVEDDDTDGLAFFGALDYDITERLRGRTELRWSREKQSQSLPAYVRCFGATEAECGDDRFDLRYLAPNLVNADGECRHPVTDQDLGLGNCLRTGDKTFKQVTGRVGLDFKVNDLWLVYGSVAFGEKPGGIQLISATLVPGPDETEGEERAVTNPFDPETITAYELGVKGVLLDGRVRFDAALFYNDWKKVVIRQLRETLPGTGEQLEQPTAFNTNAGDATVKGFEITADVGITDNLTGRFTTAWTDSELDSGQIDTFINFPSFAPDGDMSGQTMLRQPEWTSSASLSYGRPLDNDWDWYVRGDASYQSDVYTDLTNENWLPAHTYVNTTLGLKSDRYTLELWGRNIFNDGSPIAAFRDIYWTNTADQYPDANGNYQNVGARPNFDEFVPLRLTVTYPRERTFGVRGEVRFGNAVR